MPRIPPSIDLSGDLSPEDFFVCLIEDRLGLEAWRASSAAHDHTIPSSNWCAMTCLSMIMLLEGRKPPSLDELFEQACNSGVYVQKGDGSGWKGVYHKELATFISGFGYPAEFVTGLTGHALAQALSDGHYAIISVAPQIRFRTNEEPEKKSGHVVLAFAYETDAEGSLIFRIQNCAGFATLDSQIDFGVSAARLAQVFSGNATLVRSRYVRA